MSEIEMALEQLYANNASKLHQMCNKFINQYGGVASKDYDDFYSKVNLEISITIKRNNYNPNMGKTFIEYLSGVIRYAIMKEMSYRNRQKRKSDRLSYSLDEPINDNGLTIGDTIIDQTNIEQEIFGEIESPKVEKYFDRLSKKQREVAKLLAESYSAKEIQEILHLNQKEYTDIMVGIKAYNNVSILF